ncbi:hypothetical protein BSKO_10676 [Bryopsis sp. KO-2023]|nr:hypothetical protein BSKO_10676 [Bryopsis sp. KO-2023]
MVSPPICLDETPSYDVEAACDADDPREPKPTPQPPEVVIHPDDENFLERYIACQNFDPLHVVRLIRTFVPPELDPDKPEDGPSFLPDEKGARIWNGFGICDHPVDHERSLADRESAGELMIELSSEPNHSSFLLRNHILKAIVAVVDKSAFLPEEAKLVEQGMSILANIASFDILCEKVASEPELKELVIGKVFSIMDSDVLVQVLRLLSNVVVRQGKEEWMKLIETRDCMERLMWILDNTLNDTLLGQGFSFIETCMTNHEHVIANFVKLGLLDLLVSIFNSYVVKESGFETDMTLSPATRLTVERKCPTLSGETVISATRALYASTQIEEAVEALSGNAGLLMCLYHLWLVSDYDRLDDQLVLVMATLNRPLRRILRDAKGLEKLMQIVYFDFNSNAPEVQMSAIWAVLSFVSRGLRIEAERNKNMKEPLRVVSRDVKKITRPRVPPSCMQYARCCGLNLIATFELELVKVMEALAEARTERGKEKIRGWKNRFEVAKGTLSEWLIGLEEEERGSFGG